jgi:hypothetical protein
MATGFSIAVRSFNKPVVDLLFIISSKITFFPGSREVHPLPSANARKDKQIVNRKSNLFGDALYPVPYI